ncbi:MAG: hypothetical protein M3O50_22760, partial [Myxococcota bacterium]|nr:hypothetical protein [Myxococcota bacterium]
SAPDAEALESGCARRAEARLEWLRARSEGGFVPLERLERIRRDPDLANDPTAIASLAREADAMPPGIVRVEARMLVAEAWLGRMDQPDAALAELRKVVDDPGADALTAHLAQREIVSALAMAGRIDAAAAEARAHAGWLDARFVGQIQRLVRRRMIRRACLGVFAVFAVMATMALAGARRRGRLADAWHSVRSFAPLAALFVAFVGGAGGLLASHYESGNALPFLLFGVGALPLLLAARMWGAVGRTDRTARVARALLCGATVLATAFVLLEAVNPVYLEGFGL